MKRGKRGMRWLRRLGACGAGAAGACLWLASSANAVPTNGLVSYWDFEGNLNDTAGSYVGNTSAAVDNLTAQGQPAQFFTGGFGQTARLSTNLAADPNRFNAPNSIDTQLGPVYTIQSWIYPTALQDWSRLVLNWGAGGLSYHFALRNGNQVSLFHNQAGGAQVNIDSPGVVQLGSVGGWQQVVGVADGTNLHVYYNGNNVGSVPYNGTINTVGAGLGIGDNPEGGGGTNLRYQGFIDDVAIWNRALTPAEIAAEYAAKAGLAQAPVLPSSPPPGSGLVSYWAFENDLNDTASFYSNSSSLATDNLTPRGGSANFVAGKVGQALRVGVAPGDTTDLSAPRSADVNLPGVYAIEAWINPSDLSGDWQRLVLNWGGTDFAYHFAIRNNSGFNQAVSLFHGQSNGAQANVNGGTVVANQWQHIAGVADGSNLIVYLNGEAVAATPYNGTIHTAVTEGLGIGDSFSSLSGIKYNGLMDELAIWRVPLTPEQVRYHFQQGAAGYGLTPFAPVAGPSSGLVAFYEFDGHSEDTASNYAENSGVVEDDMVPQIGTPRYVAGMRGQAIALNVDLDGSLPDDIRRLQAAASADLSLPSTYTIEAWINPQSLNTWSRLFLLWGGGEGQSYHFALQNGNQVSLFHQESDGQQPNTQGGQVQLNLWQHVAAVADGAFLRVFLNGVEVALVPYDGTINSVNGAVAIGDRPNGNDGPALQFQGWLDDLAVWNVALTNDQIRTHYLNGAAGYGLTLIPEPATITLALLAGGAMWRRRRD